MDSKAKVECSIQWTYPGWGKTGRVIRKPYLLVHDLAGKEPVKMIGISVKAAEALIASGMSHGD